MSEDDVRELINEMSEESNKRILQLEDEVRVLKNQEPELLFPLNFQSRKSILSELVFPVVAYLPGTMPATAANYGLFFTADRAYEVVGVVSVHGGASSSGTVMVERRRGTEAKASGDNILKSALSTSGAANTPVYGDIAVSDARMLQRGDRLGLENGGTLTSSTELSVTVYLKLL